MQDVLARLGELRIVPVVTLEKGKDAGSLADVLIEGGLPCAEITFRTGAAAEALRILAKRGDILVGAGTVLTVDQAKAARDAGASFIVAPGFNPKVAGWCVENGMTVTPGVCTPSDIERAMEFGLEVLKFFPAEAFGGLKTLKAFSAPYPSVKFIPTGGVATNNLREYLCAPNVLACGGTWLAKSSLIEEGKFDEILKNTREAVRIAATCSQRDSQGSRQ
jgi:2-dehydro-3-deoxyphosphogluconate aldolase/(4S)-4-hydroxy-2-oxoglutarate aldolase